MQIGHLGCLSGGVSRYQISLNFKNVSNWSEGGGGQHFSLMSQIQKCLNCRRGGGSTLNETLSHFFPFFLVTPPLSKCIKSLVSISQIRHKYVSNSSLAIRDALAIKYSKFEELFETHTKYYCSSYHSPAIHRPNIVNLKLHLYSPWRMDE